MPHRRRARESAIVLSCDAPENGPNSIYGWARVFLQDQREPAVDSLGKGGQRGNEWKEFYIVRLFVTPSIRLDLTSGVN